MEKLLNKKEIAEVLGVSIKAIDKWVCEHRIPYVKLSQKCVRFIPSQVRYYLNKLRIMPLNNVQESLKKASLKKASLKNAAAPSRQMSRPKPRR